MSEPPVEQNYSISDSSIPLFADLAAIVGIDGMDRSLTEEGPCPICGAPHGSCFDPLSIPYSNKQED